MRLAFELVGGVLREPSAMMLEGVIQATESLSRREKQRKDGLLTLLGPGHPSSPDLTYLLLGSRAFGLQLKYITGFSGSPACRQQIMRFLSLHNHMRQLL